MLSIEDWIQKFEEDFAIIRDEIEESRLNDDRMLYRKLGKRYIAGINKMLRLLTDKDNLTEDESRLILETVDGWTNDVNDQAILGSLVYGDYEKILAYNDRHVMQIFQDIATARINEI